MILLYFDVNVQHNSPSHQIDDTPIPGRMHYIVPADLTPHCPYVYLSYLKPLESILNRKYEKKTPVRDQRNEKIVTTLPNLNYKY